MDINYIFLIFVVILMGSYLAIKYFSSQPIKNEEFSETITTEEFSETTTENPISEEHFKNKKNPFLDSIRKLLKSSEKRHLTRKKFLFRHLTLLNKISAAIKEDKQKFKKLTKPFNEFIKIHKNNKKKEPHFHALNDVFKKKNLKKIFPKIDFKKIFSQKPRGR